MCDMFQDTHRYPERPILNPVIILRVRLLLRVSPPAKPIPASRERGRGRIYTRHVTQSVRQRAHTQQRSARNAGRVVVSRYRERDENKESEAPLNSASLAVQPTSERSPPSPTSCSRTHPWSQPFPVLTTQTVSSRLSPSKLSSQTRTLSPTTTPRDNTWRKALSHLMTIFEGGAAAAGLAETSSACGQRAS